MFFLNYRYNKAGDNMNKTNKIIYLILSILIIILMTIVIKDNYTYKDYIKEYNYFNKIEIIKIYTNKNPEKIFKKIDNIYKKSIENNEEYLNNLISKYLDKNNINKYYINMNDTILLKGKFKVGLPDPYDKFNILKVVTVTDKCISTYLEDNKSITVISDKDCQKIALTLSNLSKEKGLELVNNNKNVEAIWYIDKKITKSDNFKKYE